jgi:hypothetical protein
MFADQCKTVRAMSDFVIIKLPKLNANDAKSDLAHLLGWCAAQS